MPTKITFRGMDIEGMTREELIDALTYIAERSNGLETEYIAPKGRLKSVSPADFHKALKDSKFHEKIEAVMNEPLSTGIVSRFSQR